MNHPENILNGQQHHILDTEVILQQLSEAWKNLQTRQPLVHCITNTVAANYVANILLAAGASPAMIDNPFEAANFVKISAALSINLGTPTTEQMQAIRIAAITAQQHDIPWVLDPVGYSPILAWRSEMIDELVEYRPSIIRGNASEISALAGHQNESRGVDSTMNSSDVFQQALNLLEHTECVAISGESDYILSKELRATIKINGGSHLQPKITATGCALGALTAAYSAVTTPTIACIAAHTHFAIAGQLAEQNSKTVGSFAVAFLDHIFSLDTATIDAYADFEIIPMD